MAQGEKVFKSVQTQGPRNAKELRKTCGPSRLTSVKNPPTDVRKILPYTRTRDKMPVPQREGNM